MPGRFTPHRHTRETTPLRHTAGPLQQRPQIPRPSLHRLAGQHLRIMITDHHRLFPIRQIDTHDRVIGRHPLTQPGQLRITAFVTTRQTTTLGHNVLLAVLGYQARQRQQEDVLNLFTNTRHSSLTTVARAEKSAPEVAGLGAAGLAVVRLSGERALVGEPFEVAPGRHP
jgi:hypothetical protein